MLRALKYLLAGLLAAVVVATAAVVISADPRPVAATVTDDPALPRLEVAGVTLHAQRFGPQDAPVVVVLHGGPGADHRSLLPLRDLAPDYHVVFYDQRGAGLSERVADGKLTLTGHLEELDAVLDAVSPNGAAVLIGHSWGGTLATAYLARRPERVATVVLIEPGFLDQTGREDWEAKARALIRRMLVTPSSLFDASRAIAEGRMLDGPDADASEDHVAARMVHAFANHPDNPYHCPGAEYDSTVWRFGARSQRAVPESASPADVDAIGTGAGGWEGAALFLTGACDHWIGTDVQTRHMGFFRDARLVEIPAAGHDVIDDQPEAALAAIRSFLAEMQRP